MRESGCGNNRVERLANRGEIVGHEPDDRGDRHRRESAVAVMPLQRFQDQLEKIMEGTAAFKGRAVAHSRLIAAAVCKHLISAIVSAPALAAHSASASEQMPRPF